MTELRSRMIQDMELRSLKENTQKAYVDAVKDLARHYNRSPGFGKTKLESQSAATSTLALGIPGICDRRGLTPSVVDLRPPTPCSAC